MIMRIETKGCVKGIVCVKEDGRIYIVKEECIKERFGETFALEVEDLTEARSCRISNINYSKDDLRASEALTVYDCIISDGRINETDRLVIENYLDHYNYRLTEERCYKCGELLGYVSGAYSIKCSNKNCGALNIEHWIKNILSLGQFYS